MRGFVGLAGGGCARRAKSAPGPLPLYVGLRSLSALLWFLGATSANRPLLGGRPSNLATLSERAEIGLLVCVTVRVLPLHLPVEGAGLLVGRGLPLRWCPRIPLS